MRIYDSGILAATVLLIMGLGRVTEASHAPHHSPMAVEDFGIKRDLSSILKDPPLQQHERLSEALQILHPMQSGPRCHYQAALNLLNDCKFLEDASNYANRDPKGDTEANLDQLETVYAARLAVCELMSADADIPADCKVVTSSEEACVKKRFGYGLWNTQQERPKSGKLCYPEGPNHKQFSRCMKALFSKNQSWTSYSNARLNAVVMCHASRDVIEKDKSLTFYKNLGEAVSGMASILESYNEKIKVWLNEHDALVEKIRTSSEQVAVDVEQGLSTFETITKSFRSFMGTMSQATESYTEGINESLAKSKASMEEHRQDLREYHKEMVESSFQHASVQRNQLETNHGAAVAALQSYHSAALGTLQFNHEVAISKVIELSDTIDTLQEKVVLSSSNIDTINQGLVNVNRTVERLDAATENLPQVLHILTTFGGIVTSPQLVIASAVSLVGLWKANGKIAGYVITAGGLSYSVHLLDIPGHIGVIQKRFQRNLAILFQRHGPVIVILGLLGFVCLLSFSIHTCIRSTYLYQYEDDSGEEGVLPSIETPGFPAAPGHRRHVKSKLLRALHIFA